MYAGGGPGPGESLHQWGAEKLYWEKDSSRSWVRPAYEEMAATLQPGDTVVVSEFRQLAGSARDVLILLHRLYSAKVEFASLRENFHTATGQGRETFGSCPPWQKWRRSGCSAARKMWKRPRRPAAIKPDAPGH